jgi:hypothetical protein
MSERRTNERLRVRFEIALSVAGREHNGLLADVSARGAQVIAPHVVVRLGDIVQVRLQRRRQPALSLPGRVVWSKDDRFALEFSELEESAQKWLDSVFGAEETQSS